jgi:hypothetical protein
MKKHMYILKQLLAYSYEQHGLFYVAKNIREGNNLGEMSIRASINNILKQQ